MTTRKKKKTSRPPRTDLHAITPLPIDFILQRMKQLKKRGIVVETVNLSRDDVAFKLKHDKMRAITTGTLRRWEGTHTRVDANTTLQVPPVWIEWVAHFVVIMVLTFFLGGCTLFIGFVSIFSFFASIILATILSVLMPISKYLDRFRKRAIIDADKQMQLISLLLTSNLPEDTEKAIEFDGTEQSLQRRMRR